MHTMHQKLTVKAKTCQGKINFASRLQKRTAVDFCHSHYLVIENLDSQQMQSQYRRGYMPTTTLFGT